MEHPRPPAVRGRAMNGTHVVKPARAAAVPLVAGVLLLALLRAWVASGGLGTIARIHLQITGAIVPLPATPDATAAYLTIRNTSAAADEPALGEYHERPTRDADRRRGDGQLGGRQHNRAGRDQLAGAFIVSTLHAAAAIAEQLLAKDTLSGAETSQIFETTMRGRLALVPGQRWINQ